jgi:hydrogenase-1 operon protein HyaF
MTSQDNRDAARGLIAGFLEGMSAWRPGERDTPSIDLSGVSPGVLAIINEVMGEGEVSIRLAGAEDVRIQETVFAGVWRVCRFDADGRLVQDRIEGCPIPAVVLQAAERGARTAPAAPAPPEGVMNAPALLHEIAAQMAGWRPGDRAHVINLTLLPLSAEDHMLLAGALPQGPVSIMSRGFGNCRISSTTARNVWRVQYFNNLQALILDTIEVVDIPEVALAAPEDIADSRERLAELLAWMGEAVEA